MRLCVLLRLAVVLHRSRSNSNLPEIRIRVNKNRVNLDFPSEWLEQYPLTLVDLSTEQDFLEVADIKLIFN